MAKANARTKTQPKAKSQENPTTGLLTPTGESVPLQGVRITGRIQGSAAELTVLQRYRNEEARPIEASYLFPLPSEAAVTGLEIRVGERTLRAEIEEREKAFERYDEALSEGNGVVLLDQERPNVFHVSVGSILPGQTVVVEIRLALLADSWERGVRLMIPSTISPRYTPPSLPPDVLREIERTTPPYALAVPFGMSIEIEAEMTSAIRVVESPSHPVRAEIDGARARVVFSRGEEAMDRDFVLTVETAEPHRAGAFLARRDGRDHLLVELRPELPNAKRAPRDILFLVDCSGSMDGDSIDQARRGVELCLRAMSEGDRFQVVRFGSTHDALFPDYQVYSQQTLEQAAPLVRAMVADLGGTEILEALVSSAQPGGGRHVDAIVLTDGQVSNESQVLEFARAHRDSVRFFTFGIGAGSSEFLVRGLARESGGEAEFIHPGERIEEKVLRQFGRIESPALADISLDWGGVKVEQAPAALPPVFSGGAFRVFARTRKGAASPAGKTVRLRGTAASGPVEWAATVATVGDDGAIPRLWARERIRDLEAGFGVAAGSRQSRGTSAGRSAIVALSKEYGVLCSETSFIAIEERPEAERTDGQVELRRVPVMVTAGWHGIGSVRRSVMGCIPPPGPVMSMSAMDMAAPALRGQLRTQLKFMRSGLGASANASPEDGDPHFEIMRERIRQISAKPLLKLKAVSRRKCMKNIGPAAFARLTSPPKPAPAPRSAKPVPAAPWFFPLLALQKANGSFELTKELIAATTLPKKDVEKLLRTSGLDRTVFATALVVVLLQRRAKDQRDVWGAAADKAQGWLDRSAGKGVADPRQWLESELSRL